jgi:hypothetical protein
LCNSLDYIVEIRLVKLLAKQRGEIELLLLAQTAEWGADPSGTTGEDIGPADLSQRPAKYRRCF